MLTTKAIEDYVAALVFLPGWSFKCEPTFTEADSMRTVRVFCGVMNTDYPPTYDVPLNYGLETNVIVDAIGDTDLDDVGHKILTACVELLLDREVVEHECREFFRVHIGTNRESDTGPSNWLAPFHPHRLSGDRAWKARQGRYGY